MTFAALCVLVFAAAFALDYADARNKLAVQAREPHRAARWSVVMYLVGLIGMVSLIKISFWLVLPECVGLYAGSWVAVRRTRKEEQHAAG